MKKWYGVHALRIAVGITMLALLLVGGAGAMKITVNASGGGDYTRIQDAIDNASAGDTILVSSGIYYENVNITKQLNLRGIGNPVVDAGGSGSAITLAANGITLEGFTATGSGGQYDYPEAGIKVTSSKNTLTGNNASNNGNGYAIYYGVGIYLDSSSNNTLTGNKMSNNGIQDADFIGGISLWYSSNNTLTDNYVSNNGNDDADHAGGISLWHSSNNTLGGNKASNNCGGGIHLSSSSNNKLSGNNASYNGNDYYGIYLDSSSNNTLSRNNASNNFGGIVLGYSSNNKLTGNTMTGNIGNFDVNGETDSDFDNYIDISNLADGRPIYYIIRVSDATYDSSSNAGSLYCISCVNVTLKNLNLNKNGYGIFFWNTTHSTIQNVNASNNGNGIYLKSSSKNTLTRNNASNSYGNGISLFSSSNNTISGNNASNNYGGGGISLSSFSNNNTLSVNNVLNNNKGIELSSSNNNKIFNNIFKNTNNFDSYDSNNDWNTTRKSGTNIMGGSSLGGNFWGNPKGTGFSQTCKDVNGDGICDKSHTLDANNIDYLPLAKDKIPPKSVTNLKNVSYAKNYINWTWKDPKDIDFKKVMVFIDGKFKKNISKGKKFYNATNFTANSKHTISTKTVDMNGNINKTWKNSSAWTTK